MSADFYRKAILTHTRFMERKQYIIIYTREIVVLHISYSDFAF